jgi:hypothetical protein
MRRWEDNIRMGWESGHWIHVACDFYRLLVVVKTVINLSGRGIFGLAEELVASQEQGAHLKRDCPAAVSQIEVFKKHRFCRRYDTQRFT